MKVGSYSLKTYAVILSILFAALANRLQAQTYTADQYYNAGNQCYQNHQYAQAITYLNAAIQLNPAYGDAFQLEGNCYYSTGDKASALNCYNKAAVLEPNNVALAQMIASMQGGAPNVQLQVNFGSTSSTTSSTTSTSSSLPAGIPTVQAAAPAAASDDSDDEDSRYTDKGKTRLIKIHGDKRKAFLYDITSAHTLDHVFLCDQVTNVQFIEGIGGKAWRIILSRQDGTSNTYDETGNLLTSN